MTRPLVDPVERLLADAVRAAPELVLGREYAVAHPGGPGRLAELFDYSAGLPFHVHPPQPWASRSYPEVVTAGRDRWW
jgi:hypothetical protein